MSTFSRQTFHPKKKQWENATWHDDFFGHHHYGVVFPSDAEGLELAELRRVAYNPEKIELETKDL